MSGVAEEEPIHNGEKGSALGPKSKLDKFRFFVQFTGRYKNLCPTADPVPIVPRLHEFRVSGHREIITRREKHWCEAHTSN